MHSLASIMSNNIGVLDPLTRNADKLVMLITERSCSAVSGISSDTRQLVRSLIIPIVARRSLRETWFDYKELGRCIRSFAITAARIHSLVNELSREQDFIKYWHTYYMCKLFQHDDEYPARPDWIPFHLYAGWVRRMVERRLKKRDVAFFYSLDKGAKQSWPSMSKEKEALVLEKHKERMGRPEKDVPADFILTLNGCVDEIFSHPPPPTKFLPSGSACLQATSNEGGALSLFGKFQYPSEELNQSLGRLRALQYSIEQWRTSWYSYACENACTDMETFAIEYEDRFIVDIHPLALEVKIVPLAEPAKFRIISKGDGYLYSALQPLQGQLISCWKNSNYSTMAQQNLEELVRSLDHPDLPLWCSGDYEAATDLIRKMAAMLIFKRLEGKVAFKDVWAAAWSFQYARCVYPDGTGADAFESQLMGHPLSFPLLCTINLAGYRTAIKRWVRDSAGAEKRRRSRLGSIMWNNVIVNGDDILFKCEKDFLPFFYQAASDVGLIISIGKNFISRDMCMINSQVFKKQSGLMTRHGYLNQRFIFGKGNFRKSSSDVDATMPTQLSGPVNEMCTLVPWTSCIIPMVVKRFPQKFFGKGFYGYPNWYLPIHLGGLGFDPKFGPATKVTISQRRLAAMFIHNPALALYRLKAVPIPVAKYYGALAKPRMVIGDYVPEGHEEESLDDPWLARLAYCNRAHTGPVQVSDGVFYSKFRRDFRLKPINPETVEKYRHVRWFHTKLPVCPPLNRL